MRFLLLMIQNDRYLLFLIGGLTTTPRILKIELQMQAAYNQPLWIKSHICT